jgi:mono/diheme cytochrome c family protein
MQPRGGNQNPLTDEQVRAVAAYVYSLSHKQGT